MRNTMDLMTMWKQARGEVAPVAWCLGDPRYVHRSNILPAHEFTPDAEREREWVALFSTPDPETLQRFAEMVAEECAKRCDQVAAHSRIMMTPNELARYLADVIRRHVKGE